MSHPRVLARQVVANVSSVEKFVKPHPRATSRAVRFVALAGLCVFASVAHAWDGAVAGKIAAVDVTGGANFGFRVYLDPYQVMCTGGPFWAYLNDIDSNYKSYVAALLLAKASGSRVLIYTTNEGGYCHIGYLSVS